MVQLCHPLLLGICTSVRPYCIVMQYHGIDGKSVTLQRELLRHKKCTCRIWLLLCDQIVEAMRYIHEDVEIIHNDQDLSSEYQIVAIFAKNAHHFSKYFRIAA